jgi:antirestriction protein ArdC
MLTKTLDIHQTITDKIVAAVEVGAGDFVMPWHRKKGGLKPRNVLTDNFYQGVNILALWVEAQSNGYSSNLWGTYRQWSEKGAQVRKGAKSSYVVFYKQVAIQTDDDDEQLRPMARATPVFNADQVDGWADPAPNAPHDADPVNTLPDVDTFISSTGARIVHGGEQACYHLSIDTIHMPDRSRFIGSPTSSPTETYYSTLCHELIHWTSDKGRCARDLSRRFGSQAYAIEELIAELGAAFLCAELGISSEPRPDHAQYIGSWLKVLKNDKRAVFAAASAAVKATRFLRDTRMPVSSVTSHANLGATTP